MDATIHINYLTLLIKLWLAQNKIGIRLFMNFIFNLNFNLF
jgi:hypothetical protein